jgi:transposase InsO family protein
MIEKRSHKYKEEVEQLIHIIRKVRLDHPTMCSRDMYYKINPIYIGRDRFEAICKKLGFQVSPRRKWVKTTDSTGVKRFPNLIKNVIPKGLDHIWSSDITYYEVNQVFYYITFIMDNYSRRILGHSVSGRLQTEQTTLPALRDAIRTRGEIQKGIILHSDGGGQYYDQDFLKLTSKFKFKNSMCEMAYENGKAERLNGVIKNNYLRHWKIESLSDLIKSVDRAVRLYNEEKPHIGLQRIAPCEFENKMFNLGSPNRSKDERVNRRNDQFVRASSPNKLSQTDLQTQISSMKCSIEI